MSSDQWVDRVVKGLAQKPAYLLYFGVCLLVFGAGSTLGVVSLVANNTHYIPWAIGLMVVAVILATVVITQTESAGRQAPDGTTGDVDFDPIFQAIHTNMRKALGVSHTVFRDRMLEECAQFRAMAGHWANGQIRATQRTYNQLLVTMYEAAQQTIFATTTQDYLPAWEGGLGAEIVAAHINGKAKVIRVFIFDSLSTVPDRAIAQMRRQHATGKIDVRVYGIEDDVRFDIPSEINKNFAIVDDGDAIASTDPAAGTSLTGTLFFKDPHQKETYRNLRDELMRGSRAFTEWAESRDISLEGPTKTGLEPAITRTATVV